MNFLANYGLFLLKSLTLVIAILTVVVGIIALSTKNRLQEKGKIKITNLTKAYNELQAELQQEILASDELKKIRKNNKQQQKAKKSIDRSTQKTFYVINFHGDMRAQAVNCLREEVTAVLTIAKPNDEIVVRLESPGGMAHAYGLGASQLQRIRDKQLRLTVCVDKVAASGGYMMACVADKILAAPFAIIGSIGVLAQLPNFNRVLQRHDVDFEQFTAGEYKRTVTMFGKNTSEGREKFQQQLEEMHDLFKQHVKSHRPQLNVDHVATGEYWCGSQALSLGLVDTLTTSDDYLLAAHYEHDIYEVSFTEKRSLSAKLLANAKTAAHEFTQTTRTAPTENIYF